MADNKLGKALPFNGLTLIGIKLQNEILWKVGFLLLLRFVNVFGSQQSLGTTPLYPIRGCSPSRSSSPMSMVMMVVMVMMANASVLLQRPAAVGSAPAAAARPLEAVLQRRRAGGRT